VGRVREASLSRNVNDLGRHAFDTFPLSHNNLSLDGPSYVEEIFV
jgi:hypothetical protein